MPRKKSLKTTGKQKVLALIFAMTMVSGFAIVWATAQYYDSNNVSTQLFISDSDTEYGNTLVTDNFNHFPKGNVTSRQLGQIGVFWNETLWTPAYLGNNTWGVSVEEFAVAEYADAQFQFIMEMPQIDNWIIEYVLVNMTAPAEANKMVSNVFHYDAPYSVIPTGGTTDLTQFTEIYRDLTGDIGTSDVNMTVSLAESLRIYDFTQETTSNFFNIVITLDDALTDGLDGFSWTWTVEIWGHAQTTTTLETILTWGLSGAIILNIFVIVYMTDAVDMGGFIRDIPKKAKARRR